MLNVALYLVSRADQVPRGATVLPLDGADQIRIVERHTAWPRAFFAARGCAAIAASTASLDFCARSRGPLFQSTSAMRWRSPPCAACRRRRDCAGHGYVLATNATSFHVTSTGPGLAVLAESFVEQDFQATVNGEAVPYIRVNHGFKAVFIAGPGEWTVTFTYRPAFWRWSRGLAALGLGGLAALLLIGTDAACAAGLSLLMIDVR